MRAVSDAMQAHLEQVHKTMATCVSVVLSNGVWRGYTDHTRDITITGNVYTSATGILGSALESSVGFVVDNTEIVALMDSSIELDIESGLYDNAEVHVFQVNFLDLSQGRVPLKTGHVGRIERSGNRFEVEVRGLMQILNKKIGRMITLDCDARLGDARCGVQLNDVIQHGVDFSIIVDEDRLTLPDIGVDSLFEVGKKIVVSGSASHDGTYTLTQVFFNYLIVAEDLTGSNELVTEFTVTQLTNRRFSGLVTAVESGDEKRKFTHDITLDAEGNSFSTTFFKEGTIKFTSGNNSGYIRDIRNQDGTEITVYHEFNRDIEIGDALELTMGCDKKFSTCENTFDNVQRHRGFPHVPTFSDVLDSPVNTGSSTR